MSDQQQLSRAQLEYDNREEPSQECVWSHYGVWRRQMADNACIGQWIRTSHSIKARTDNEAQSKLRTMFEGAGFSAMSLVAVPSGESPND